MSKKVGFDCESKDGKKCTSRNYHVNKHEGECHYCCYECKHAVEMTCNYVCPAVAEYYFPEEA